MKKGLVLCRVTVNMDGAPHGSQVWVDPTLPKMLPLLEHGMLVPIDPRTGEDKPLPVPPPPETATAENDEGVTSPGSPQAVIEPPATPES